MESHKNQEVSETIKTTPVRAPSKAPKLKTRSRSLRTYQRTMESKLQNPTTDLSVFKARRRLFSSKNKGAMSKLIASSSATRNCTSWSSPNQKPSASKIPILKSKLRTQSYQTVACKSLPLCLSNSKETLGDTDAKANSAHEIEILSPHEPSSPTLNSSSTEKFTNPHISVDQIAFESSASSLATIVNHYSNVTSSESSSHCTICVDEDKSEDSYEDSSHELVCQKTIINDDKSENSNELFGNDRPFSISCTSTAVEIENKPGQSSSSGTHLQTTNSSEILSLNCINSTQTFCVVKDEELKILYGRDSSESRVADNSAEALSSSSSSTTLTKEFSVQGFDYNSSSSSTTIINLYSNESLSEASSPGGISENEFVPSICNDEVETGDLCFSTQILGSDKYGDSLSESWKIVAKEDEINSKNTSANMTPEECVYDSDSSVSIPSSSSQVSSSFNTSSMNNFTGDHKQTEYDVFACLSPDEAFERAKALVLPLIIPYLNEETLKIGRQVCQEWCRKITNSKYFWTKFSYKQNVANVDWKLFWKTKFFRANNPTSFTWDKLSNQTNVEYLYKKCLLFKYMKLENCSFTGVFLQWIFSYCENLEHLNIVGVPAGIEEYETLYPTSFSPKNSLKNLSTLTIKSTGECKGLLSERFIAQIIKAPKALKIVRFSGFSSKTYSNIELFLMETEASQRLTLEEIHFEDVRTDSTTNLMHLLPILCMPTLPVLKKFTLSLEKPLNVTPTPMFKTNCLLMGKGAIYFINNQSRTLIEVNLNNLPISEEIFLLVNRNVNLRKLSVIGTNIKDDKYVWKKFPKLEQYNGPTCLDFSPTLNMKFIRWRKSLFSCYKSDQYQWNRAEILFYGFMILFGLLFCYLYSCHEAGTGIKKSSCNMNQPEAWFMAILVTIVVGVRILK